MSGAAAPPSTNPAPPGSALSGLVPPPIRRARRRWSPYLALGAIALVLVVVASGFAFGWFAAPAGGPCPSGVTLKGEGANFILALVSSWQTGFAASNGNRVNYNPSGAGAGITDLQAKLVDFAATDEPLSSEQVAAMPSPVLTFPIAGGALAIVYNLPGLTDPINLTGAELAAIYLGQVTYWNDPHLRASNPGAPLPDQPITTVHRSDSAGTTYVLTDLLSQDSPAWNGGPGKGIQVSWPATAGGSQAVKGNSGLATYVLRNPNTIGYVDLTDVLDSPGLQYARIGNPAGAFVLPTLANTASAIDTLSKTTAFPASGDDWQNVSMVNSPGPTDYPLATFAYFFAFRSLDSGYAPSLAKAEVLVAWLDWTITQGQGAAATLSYVSLDPAIVAIDQAGIRTMTYGGATVPSCTAS